MLDNGLLTHEQLVVVSCSVFDTGCNMPLMSYQLEYGPSLQFFLITFSWPTLDLRIELLSEGGSIVGTTILDR